ncbi:MAG: NCS2 family permease, partial [Clostridium perfringens]|nr:NCS2 family permease [Clostridium perfringens]
MEKFFKLKENNTDAKTEFIAGLTTFMTMAYILIVNPSILSAAGMDQGAVFTATALSAVIATLIMGLYAKLPFAQAPGMGLNAFFAYTIVIQMGYSFEFALTAVLLEGIIFILLTIFNVREAIVDSIPKGIKNAISVGIGLLIALIGLEGAGIVVHTDGGTIVSLGNIVSGSGLLAIIGLLITSVLIAKNVKGALFIGMIITAIIGIPMGITPIPSKIISMPPSIAPTFFKFDFHNIFSLDMVIALFTLLFMDMFDTIGTLVGVATKAKMLDKDGKVPNIKKALFSDAVGTTLGACLGTSTVSTFVESASGVAEGGRTGLTAVSTAFMFFLALFFAPLFAVIT